jgi:hypothetical protein
MALTLTFEAERILAPMRDEVRLTKFSHGSG